MDNSYINTSSQKERVPGCVEHAMIGEQIQKANANSIHTVGVNIIDIVILYRLL